MNLTPDKTQVSRDILSQYGNMSSATVLFILEALLHNNCRTPCVMLGFGPGLVAEAALLL
jgi:predicted naringenin-chalcone synthase